MPQTVAPPPWNGDAATGHWPPAAPDSAPLDGASSEARTSEPALQTPAAAARTAAAGVASTGWVAGLSDGPAPAPAQPPRGVAPSAGRALAIGFALSAVALLVAGVAVGTLAAMRLLLSGDGRMTFTLAASALLLAGFAVGIAATLAVPNRWVAPRPATLVLAAIVTTAWPLSGYPAPAAAAAVIAVGLALAHDIRHPSGRRVRGQMTPALLAAAAVALTIAGVAVAETHRTEPAAATAQSPEPNALLGESRVDPSTTDAEDAPADPAAGAKDAPSDRAARAEDVPADPAAGAEDATADPVPGVEDSPTSPDAAVPSDPSADVTPTDPAITAPSSDLADFVRGYYEQLNAKRFADAWASLSPAVQRSFGGFEHWRNGYGQTLSSTPSAIKVEGATVTHVLVARDRGCPQRRFRVRWRLEPADGTWIVAALSASALDDITCSS